METAKRLTKSIFEKLGYRITKKDAVPNSAYGLDSFFKLLKQFGFAPGHIVDVGANKGHWTRAAIQFFPDAYYTLVEPQDHLKVHIQDLLDRGHKIRWINAGAGDRTGSVPFTISYRDDSSSFVPTREQAQAAGCQQIIIPMMMLNDIAARSGAPLPDLVKIDAEGFDLKVLAGASELLGKTDIFLLEAVICARDYENTLVRVIQRMADAGYRPIDFTDLNRSPKHGVLWLCEVAFLRNNSALLERATSYE
jgi:FkbM family methyltransferase